MAADLLGQYDPAMTEYMNEVMALYREIFQANYHWTFLIDGTSRTAIESSRFHHRTRRQNARPSIWKIRTPPHRNRVSLRSRSNPLVQRMGEVYAAEEIGAALDKYKPKR